MRIQQKHSCDARAVVKLIRGQVKGLTAKKAQTIVQALKLDKPVVGKLTGADLLSHAKRVRRNYASDGVLMDGEFSGKNLSTELPCGINAKKAMHYFRRLLKNGVPVFTKEKAYAYNFTSMHDPNPEIYYYGDGWKFTKFGNKLIKLIKKDKTPKG